jgi:hypothetical protein
MVVFITYKLGNNRRKEVGREEEGIITAMGIKQALKYYRLKHL